MSTSLPSTLSPCERSPFGGLDLESVMTHHDRLRDGEGPVTRLDLVKDHLASAGQNLKSAGEHAVGTVAMPFAMLAMAPAVLVPYAGLFVLLGLQLGAAYTLSAPGMAARDMGEAARHAWLGVKVGVTGKCPEGAPVG